ncbi:hypothetical protein [Microvirga brassicacearum]|uniref:Uncharacterized protein n=1 Tax=Microvirga brassicacearum TaxID=2580413 RepID=A0A5N3P6S5_9HYPH|nr:hypothetical protein [Microvirga brassicacearum]KAB0265426.1 hypothetical protein FEZ63_18265 [Microvirga brassicacearum]
MVVIPATIYALLCLLVANRGRHSQLGYLGTFLLSLFLTPVIVFIGLLLLTPPPDEVEIVRRQRVNPR